MFNPRVTGLLLILIAIGACSREEPAPERQTTTGLEARNQAVDVSGCLRAGDADSTFVLIASRETPSENATTTYQLMGPARLDLKSYVGHQVEITGRMRAEEAVVSESGTTPEKTAKGTSGNPGVETKTNFDLRQVTVDTVKTVADRCSE
jgi:hypothetical protein